MLGDRVVQPAVVSPGYPSGQPSSLRLRILPLAAPAQNLRLAPPALHSGSTGGRLCQLGSVFCRRLDRWQTSDLHRRYALPFDPWLTFQLALASFLRQGREPTFDSHRTLILQLGSCPASGSHRLLLQPRLAPSAAAASGLRQLPPVCQTSGELPTRIGCSSPRLHRFRITRLAPCASTSGWAFDAPLTSTEPCIAGKPSMSIPYPPVRASSGSASLTTFDLRRLLQSLAQPAIPLWLSPQVSPSGWAGGDSPTLIGFSFHQPFRQPTPDALLGSSVEVTLRPFNLWMQVQKSS
jgi:hypothetical protein